MGIAKKNLALVSVCLSVFAVVTVLITTASLREHSQEEIESFRNRMLAERKCQIQDLVTSSFSIFETANFYEDALRALSATRFGKDGQNYFGVVDRTGIIMMHPVDKSLELRNVSEIGDWAWNEFWEKTEALLASEEGGFIEHTWPHPQTGKLVRKLSYVRAYKPWEWVLHTGIYLDDLEVMVEVKEAGVVSAFRAQLKKLVTATVVCLLGTGLISGWISRRLVRPIHQVTKKLGELASGRADLTTRLTVTSRDELAVLVGNVNAIMDRFHHVFQAVAENAEHLSGASTDLTHLSVCMAEDAAAANRQSVILDEASSTLNQGMRRVGDMEEVTRQIVQIQTRIEGIDGAVAVQTENGQQVSEFLKKATDELDEGASAVAITSGVAENMSDAVSGNRVLSEKMTANSHNVEKSARVLADLSRMLGEMTSGFRMGEGRG